MRDEPQVVQTGYRADDRVAIYEMLGAYAAAVDANDGDALAKLMNDTVHVTAPATGPVAALFAPDPVYDGKTPIDGPDYARAITRNMRHLSVTQHLITNPRITFTDEDGAYCTAYLRAIHFIGDPTEGIAYEVGGYYHLDLVRVLGDWRIAHWRLTVTWEFGNAQAVMAPPI